MLLDGIKYKGNDIIRAYKNGSIIWNPVEYKFFNVSETALTLLGPKSLPISITKDIAYVEDVKFLLGQNMKDIAKKSVVIDASNLRYSAMMPGSLWCDTAWHWNNEVNLNSIIFTNFVVSLGKNSLLEECFEAYFGGELRTDLSQPLDRNLILSLICHTPAHASHSKNFLSLKNIDLKNLSSIHASFSQKLPLEKAIKMILDTSFYTSKSSNLKAKKEIFFAIRTNQFADFATKGYGNKIINFLIKDSLKVPFGKKLSGSNLLKIINLSILPIPFSSNVKGTNWVKTSIVTKLKTSERVNAKSLFILQNRNASALFSSTTIEEFASANLLSKTYSSFYIESIQPLKQKIDILFNASASNFSKSETYDVYIDYLLTTKNQTFLNKEVSVENFVNENLNFFYGLLPLNISEPNYIHEEASIILLGNQNLFDSFEKEVFSFGAINNYNICRFGLNTNLVDFISDQKARLITSGLLSLNEEDFLQFIQGENGANFISKSGLFFQKSIKDFYSFYKIVALTNLLTHQTKFLDSQEVYAFFTHENLEKTSLLSMFLIELVYSIQAKSFLSKTKWKKAEIGRILTQSALNNILDFTKIESFLINRNYSIFTASFIDLVLSYWLIFESRNISINNKTIMQLDKWEYPIETERPEGSDLFLSQVLSFSTIII